MKSTKAIFCWERHLLLTQYQKKTVGKFREEDQFYIKKIIMSQLFPEEMFDKAHEILKSVERVVQPYIKYRQENEKSSHDSMHLAVC